MISFHSVSSLVEPLGILWLLHLGAAAVLIRQRKWRGALFPLFLAALIWLTTATPVPVCLLETLERPTLGAQLAALPVTDAVIVLGGGFRHSQHDPLGLDFTNAGDRVLAGLEVLRQQKARVLVIGGSKPYVDARQRNEAAILRDWLAAWQFTNAPIYDLGTCTNTRQEAEHTQALVQEHHWQSVTLVTSAYHMDRAAATFRKLGIVATGVACDYQVLRTGSPTREFYLAPQAENLAYLGYYLHEQIGWLIYRWRDWI